MSEILRDLGVLGYQHLEECRVLSSLLTGDPILFIGRHGSAKTMLGWVVSKGLDVPFQNYDASKSMFEDILGMPNPKALQEGCMEYVPGPMTLWDKEFLFVDEVNRAEPELQSKWLEIIRSRKVMGFPTKVKWVWGAMNPADYEGANILDEAFVGRFAQFIYVPEVLDMETSHRARIAEKIGVDDMPAMDYWLEQDKKSKLKREKNGKLRDNVDYKKAGEKLRKLLILAKDQYKILRAELPKLPDFVARFAKSLQAHTSKVTKESDEAGHKGDQKTKPILLDGRRLGFMYRSLLATRAIEIASASLFRTKIHDIRETARIVVKGCIPIGINEGGANTKEQEAKVDATFNNLRSYFDKDANERLLNLAYELMTSPDLARRVEILISEKDLDEMNKNSAWTKLCTESNLDMSVLAMLVLKLEANHPSTIPANVVDQLAQKVDEKIVAPDIRRLEPGQMLFSDRLTALVEKYDSDKELPQKLLAVAEVNEWLRETSGDESIPETSVKSLENSIKKKCRALSRIIEFGSKA